MGQGETPDKRAQPFGTSNAGPQQQGVIPLTLPAVQHRGCPKAGAMAWMAGIWLRELVESLKDFPGPGVLASGRRASNSQDVPVAPPSVQGPDDSRKKGSN